ncbi:NtaA/DmoA family FMN-dependent monooxygenase [Streptomyces sp. TS71-3]|uniref:NtaA/DmoA family FMN-dependent monooxygenase n=1 Tax=Streptomyces sp. TS71-3 TaxID=2733862 RepID=UPI001B1A6BB9|nr:NtaA/DmoA family FMN-dependent monooxygenase [Streptomyces sp. TS71-3]GHJ36488.1 nitrilotriacetate monooxygenase component A [Streptomyces sp. TS71-3]
MSTSNDTRSSGPDGPGTPGTPGRPGKPLKQVHLAAHFPGVNNTTVWSDPAAGSHIAFDSFAHFARTAERAGFDFLFLAEGLRLREQGGRIYDLDVVGRPDTFTVLTALAAVTGRLGLTGTINSTFNEPYEVARQFASLDHLSGGRAAWNVVTSWDAFTGENFRRGGFLPQEERYSRAKEFLRTATELFDSWQGDEIVADRASGTFLRDARAGAFVHKGPHFDIEGRFNVPRSPQGRPVIFQAGDSDEGREFAASSADAIFSRYSTRAEGQEFYRDVKGRLARYGRTPDQLLVLPAATFVLGDTDEEAHELAREVRRRQVSGATAIRHLEFVWNRDLSAYDPEGPLPEIDPDPGEHTVARGRAQVRMYRDPLRTAREWRELAAANKWSIRDLVIETGGRQAFVGSPATVAASIDDFVQSDASDGFILVPHITPGGLDAFADTVVPLLQERGVFRTEYEGATLRDHLGLGAPPAAGAGAGTGRAAP